MNRLSPLLSVLSFEYDHALEEKIAADLEAARAQIDTEGPEAFRCLGCLETCPECSPRKVGKWRSGSMPAVRG